MSQHLLERFNRPGPKRILSLDGGGIRGIVALEILEMVEQQLAIKHGRPVPLWEYFDLIGGTSTGAIIATCLACGKSATDTKQAYLELGRDIFGDPHSPFNPFDFEHFLKKKFDHKKLEKHLRSFFGDATLGDEILKTGLAIVAKRADRNSTWVLHNHPGGKYYAENKDISLVNCVRSSSAAPSYFQPHVMKVKQDGQKGAFVDGGVSTSNNPIIRLLMLATLKSQPFKWRLSEDDLFVCSVGTGRFHTRVSTDDIEKNNLLHWANEVPNMLLGDANMFNQMLIQWLTDSPTAIPIDRELGTMEGELIAGRRLFSYARYNVQMNLETLVLTQPPLTFQPTEKMLDEMSDMGNVEHLEKLQEIAAKYAGRAVLRMHFPDEFSLDQPAKPAIAHFKKGEKPALDFQSAIKKPLPVEVFQMDRPFEVETLEGTMRGKAGDWLMVGVNGEMYPCDQAIFDKTYDLG